MVVGFEKWLALFSVDCLMAKASPSFTILNRGGFTSAQAGFRAAFFRHVQTSVNQLLCLQTGLNGFTKIPISANVEAFPFEADSDLIGSGGRKVYPVKPACVVLAVFPFF